MSNYSNYEATKEIIQRISKKIPQGIMIGNTTVGHITWQMYLMRDYLKLDGTPLANASNDYSDLLKFAQDNNLITADTTDKSLFKYDSTNDVLTLPDFIGLVVQGGNTIEEKEAGLPNIEGTFGVRGSQNIPNVYEPLGAFYLDFSDYGVINQSTSSSSGQSRLVGLNASYSSSIYGKSTTVQPPAITLIPQIKYKRSTTYEGIDLNKLMPLGSVISFMGVTAPEYYLACDGTVYNISEYSVLADFFETQFGAKNHFGGNGTTTFAVPDLRGEFLRGTGTNSHTNNGNGASVGVHQDGTMHGGMRVDINKNVVVGMNNSNNNYYRFLNADNTMNETYLGATNRLYTAFSSSSSGDAESLVYTSRPTNTSVLYCIKYK